MQEHTQHLQSYGETRALLQHVLEQAGRRKRADRWDSGAEVEGGVSINCLRAHRVSQRWTTLLGSANALACLHGQAPLSFDTQKLFHRLPPETVSETATYKKTQKTVHDLECFYLQTRGNR